MIDTHAHLNFKAFNKDRNEVIKKCQDNDTWVLNVGTKYNTSLDAVNIAQKGIFAAVGLHPIHATPGLIKIKTDPEEGGFEISGEDFDINKYRELVSEKVVAIGEIGLDYYYRPKTKKKLSLF